MPLTNTNVSSVATVPGASKMVAFAAKAPVTMISPALEILGTTFTPNPKILPPFTTVGAILVAHTPIPLELYLTINTCWTPVPLVNKSYSVAVLPDGSGVAL